AGQAEEAGRAVEIAGARAGARAARAQAGAAAGGQRGGAVAGAKVAPLPGRAHAVVGAAVGVDAEAGGGGGRRVGGRAGVLAVLRVRAVGVTRAPGADEHADAVLAGAVGRTGVRGVALGLAAARVPLGRHVARRRELPAFAGRRVQRVVAPRGIVD